MGTDNTKFLAFSNRGTREENQDSYTTGTMRENTAVRGMDRGELFIVADGMGGHKAGREAAEEVCDQTFNQYYSANIKLDFDESETILGALAEVLEKINVHLSRVGQDNPDRAGWGCTVSVLILREGRYYFAHTGDTRIYFFQNGKSTLLTEDQNVAFQMFKYRHTTYEEYLEAPGHNKLLSYMGQGEGISVITGQGECLPGDVFLLCTDGLQQFAEIRDLEILSGKLAGEQDDSQDFMEKLDDTLRNELIVPEEAKDNVTYILAGRK